MLMTQSEIVSSYKRAENKRVQIRTLSELNACEEKEIKEILERNKVIIPAGVLKRSINWKKELENIRSMRAAGLSQYIIAETYGVSQTTISNLLSTGKIKGKKQKEVGESEYYKRSSKAV